MKGVSRGAAERYPGPAGSQGIRDSITLLGTTSWRLTPADREKRKLSNLSMRKLLEETTGKAIGAT